MYVGDGGAPLNSDAEIMLDGELRVGYARVLELRKLNGKRRVPRLSVRAAQASVCSAVVLPLVEVSSGRWATNRATAPPVLVPLLSLGRQVVAVAEDGEPSGTFSLGTADVAAGGQLLQAMSLTPELFKAAAMQAVVKDLMTMKVAELKEELAARGEPVWGNKAWLRRRLHSAIVCNYIDGADNM